MNMRSVYFVFFRVGFKPTQQPTSHPDRHRRVQRMYRAARQVVTTHAYRTTPHRTTKHSLSVVYIHTEEPATYIWTHTHTRARKQQANRQARYGLNVENCHHPSTPLTPNQPPSECVTHADSYGVLL
mmetsp:Transcript_14400/g.41445  ORF Transcript_14400/g.41445 Transcript_14400/m.41445 type:complete len:127 (-) Transcript_14400:797-1177(-)